MLHSHYLFVVLFTLIYLVKTILLLSDRDELLEKFKKKTKVLEMIVSFGFLATGIFLMTQMPQIPLLMYVKIGLILASIPLALLCAAQPIPDERAQLLITSWVPLA